MWLYAHHCTLPLTPPHTHTTHTHTAHRTLPLTHTPHTHTHTHTHTQSNYTIDYTNQGSGIQTFNLVFAVMFNGCSGIMGEYQLALLVSASIQWVVEHTLRICACHEQGNQIVYWVPVMYVWFPMYMYMYDFPCTCTCIVCHVNNLFMLCATVWYLLVHVLMSLATNQEIPLYTSTFGWTRF